MKYYYEKKNEEQCEKNYTSMVSQRLENECNKVKKNFGKNTKCSNICKVNLIEMIDSLSIKEEIIDEIKDLKLIITGRIDYSHTYPDDYFILDYKVFYKRILELNKNSNLNENDKDIIKRILDYIKDKIKNYFGGNIDINIEEEKFKLIIENNHLKKEIDAITLRSQEYLQDIEEDNKFKKGQDIIRDRIEFYNKWLHKLKKTTLIVHFILVFIVIGMLVYKLS